MKLLEIKQITGGMFGKYAIKTAFEMKEDIKIMMPSAKWDYRQNLWCTGEDGLEEMHAFRRFAIDNYDLVELARQEAIANDVSVRFVDHVYHFKTRDAKDYIISVLKKYKPGRALRGNDDKNVLSYKGKKHRMRDAKMVKDIKKNIVLMKYNYQSYMAEYLLVNKPLYKQQQDIKTVLDNNSNERVLIGIISFYSKSLLARHNVEWASGEIATVTPLLYKKAEKALQLLIQERALKKEKELFEKWQVNKLPKLDYDNLENLLNVLAQIEDTFMQGDYVNHTDEFYSLLKSLGIEEGTMKMADLRGLLEDMERKANNMQHLILSRSLYEKKVDDGNITIRFDNAEYRYLDIKPILAFFGMEELEE